MIVAIQPSYGNPDAVRHFQETLEQLVPFGESAGSGSVGGTRRGNLSQTHL